jgi:clan AA aspartic protease (TIGR02281 family)
MARVFPMLALAGLVPIATALAALLGLGVARDLTPIAGSLTAFALVGVPVAGLWALFGRSSGALAAACWLWPTGLLAALSGYFPGELTDAVSTGFAVIAAPGGSDASAGAARLAQRAAAPLQALPQGNAAPDEAPRAAEACPPAPTQAAGDAVALPYEGSGHSLALPVQFGDDELNMLFDTGATFTTLDRARLRQLGIPVPSDAPEITLRTANGERRAQLVLVPRVWVGGLPVDAVTVGVCEECADERVAGLLGLIVSGQFLVTLDTARKEVIFQPRGGEADRLVDIGPWLEVSSSATVYPDERVEVRVRARSRAPRAVARADVEVACGQDRFTVSLRDIPAGGQVEEEPRLPRGVDCDPYKITLAHARW